VQRRVIHQPQPKVEPKIEVEQKVNSDSSATRIGDLRLRGQQQRDRIERLYGASGASLINFIYIGNFLQKLSINDYKVFVNE